MVNTTFDSTVATISLNDPARRNALSLAMFDALDASLRELTARDQTSVVILRGQGNSFCAGFDLGAVLNDPPLMATYIRRLSAVNRSLRRLPHVVIAAAQGAAIAGGCALLTACDLVIVSRQTKLGYPVHRLGVSPAVTIPTLQQMIGSGPARALLMSGELIDGSTAHRLGLASHLVDLDDQVVDRATELARTIARHGPNSIRMTKHWLNELDGSLNDSVFNAPAEASTKLVEGDEAKSLLRKVWQRNPEQRG